MQFVMGERKKLVVLIVIGLLVAVACVIALVLRNQGPAPGSKDYLTQVLEAEETKRELEEGVCSDSTKRSLAQINTVDDASVAARAYETQGLCHVYSNNLDDAKMAYEKAKELFSHADDQASVERLQGAVESIERILSEAAKDRPGPDADPQDYPDEGLAL